MELATAFDATLPEWLIADLDGLPRILRTDEERMRLVNDLADRNWRAGNGGPFAAIVVDDVTGDLVSVGVNVVLSSGLTAAHAEVTAPSLAQRAVGRWDLGADGAQRRGIRGVIGSGSTRPLRCTARTGRATPSCTTPGVRSS